MEKYIPLNSVKFNLKFLNHKIDLLHFTCPDPIEVECVNQFKMIIDLFIIRV